MKKVLVLLVGLGLVISCDKEEALDDSSNTFDTTSIMAIVESGNNNTSRDVNRPGSVLNWIETIEITADHVGTIGGTYKVSDTYTMVDDGSGEENFILENVALGENKFEAFAKSYQEDAAEEFVWVENKADAPWEWVDAQRGRAPNTNFRDTDNDPQLIYENPSAGQNAVNFDMMAESGRLIVAVKLSDEIRNDISSNFVYGRYTVTYADVTTGTTSANVAFNGDDDNLADDGIHTDRSDDLLTFYFSDNDKSLKGACVKFDFDVCDTNPYVTNAFSRQICIPENGQSIGCVFEVGKDAVVEDVTDFNFTFDWQELDCNPCASDNYVTTVPAPTTVEDLIAELCDSTPSDSDNRLEGSRTMTSYLNRLSVVLGDSTIDQSLLDNGGVTVKDIKNFIDPNSNVVLNPNSGFFLLTNGTNASVTLQVRVDDIDYEINLGDETSLMVKIKKGSAVNQIKLSDNSVFFIEATDNYVISNAGYDGCN